MSELDRLTQYAILSNGDGCEMTKVYDVKSPELDDEGAVVVPGEEKPKLKLHKCEVCELPVAQSFHEPSLAESTAFLTLSNVDTVYQPQWGPVCGAASVAGTVLSLLKAHGHGAVSPSGVPWKDLITVRFVQDIYASLGVPDVDKTTAAVGNLTLKKCCMMLRVPELPGAQLTVTEITFLLASNDAKAKADAEWARLKKGMAEGARYLYHSRNHYNRVFGWRELYEEPKAVVADSQQEAKQEADCASCRGGPTKSRSASMASEASLSSLQEEGQGQENAAPLTSTSSSASTAAAGESDGKSSEAASEEGRPLLPANTPRRRVGGSGVLAVKRLAAKANAARTGSSSSAAAPCDPPYAPASMAPFLVKRQILMAKKGQRPQHWVDWEAVAQDTASHKLHKIFEIKMVQR